MKWVKKVLKGPTKVGHTSLIVQELGPSRGNTVSTPAVLWGRVGPNEEGGSKEIGRKGLKRGRIRTRCPGIHRLEKRMVADTRAPLEKRGLRGGGRFSRHLQ